jgi:tungstate transport system substrate-binding protein
MRHWNLTRGALVALAFALGSGAATRAAEKPFITLASSSAPVDSGLLAQLLPKFTADTGIEVRVRSVGLTQAFALGKRGEVDVLLVNDRAAENLFVTDRHALERRDFMYGDFVIIGPRTDPANIGDAPSAPGAFKLVVASKAPFITRGDDSGTHRAEQRIWSAAGRVPESGRGEWYFATPGGLSAAVALSAEKRGYTLVDRANWLALADRRALIELVSRDLLLRDSYSVLVVNDLKHRGVKFAQGKQLADWLTGHQGRVLISAFRIAEKQVYFVE